ncbi:helix-turn-helix domain-containing protein [Acidithiobacillus acidisediminis]
MQLLARGESARSVAAVVGKSERTLYRWMRNSGTAQQA